MSATTPQSATIDLVWPAGGLNRRRAYQQQPPFTTPNAQNVRPDSAIDGRERGGSRPALSKAFSEQISGGSNYIRMLTDVTWMKSGVLTTRLLASANGALWREEPAGTMEVVSSSTSLASDRVIQAAERGQKVYIADNSAIRVEGTDGVRGTGNTKLDASSVSDWTAKGISTTNDRLVIFDTSDNADIFEGVYVISSVASGEITLSENIADGSVGTCSFRIESAAKIYNPATNSLAVWGTLNVNEVQTIAIDGTPNGGTFKLRWNGETTADIAYNASASVVHKSLEKLNGLEKGALTEGGGPLPDTAVTIEFSGQDVRKRNIPIMRGLDGDLTGGSDVDLTVKTTTKGKSNGYIPLGCSIIVRWKDRLVLAGSKAAPHGWFMGRAGNPNNFDYGRNDAAAAVAGTASEAGELGEPVTALIPHNDDCLVIGCTNSIWAMRGDPATGGALGNLSNSIGIVDKNAWCHAPSMEGKIEALVFLSPDGIYAMSATCGSPPTSISRNVLPDELLNVDRTSVTVSMAYDIIKRGILIAVSNNDESSTTHFWFDWETKSFWPEVYTTAHEAQVLFARRNFVTTGNLVVWGGRDGFIRRSDDTVSQDDGANAITSFIDYGPLRLGGRDDVEGLVQQIDGITAANSGDIDWAIRTGASVEGAYNATSRETGEWNSTGLHASSHPRQRGAVAFIRLSNGEANKEWGLEGITLKVKRCGRRRF